MHWYCLPVPQRLETDVLLISSSPVTSGLWRVPCFFSDAMSGVLCQNPRFYTILDDAILEVQCSYNAGEGCPKSRLRCWERIEASKLRSTVPSNEARSDYAGMIMEVTERRKKRIYPQ
ncbi:hypothetical protein CY34DRAFT_729359 [Suillus luteus UH-Slu-Lm8-n1]|uniref:Uncharacterized protein n=1 Tax=Suillus luteus UH-Slu-Lm8-n1 TaxID=930992 RepID=A0A0D0BE88_9AGAM|nr:hypothetical protein CY34DRAFT_729359 [Suillus luteus UH-Slu-Lm8-n1]